MERRRSNNKETGMPTKEPKMLSADKVARELKKSEKETRTKIVEDLSKEIGTWGINENFKKLEVAPEKLDLTMAILKEGGWKASIDPENGAVTVQRPEVAKPKPKEQKPKEQKPSAKPGTRRAGRDPGVSAS